MNDFFEIDLLDVESDKSGDAIALRYSIVGETKVHVVDGGFQATGESIRDHIKKYYSNATYVDNVVLTHPDGDHAGGLRTILEEFDVGALWMLRPWTYVAELIDRFPTVSSAQSLIRLLREAYPNITALEEIANRRGIPIYEPFQGAVIGAFFVMAPSKARYLDLLVQSECTPEAEERSAIAEALGAVKMAAARGIAFVRAAWGEESFSPEDVSAENEMSVVQYANMLGYDVLLTGDVGRGGLRETIDFAPSAGLALPGIDRFQVPHHGSRRNLTSELLDELLGPRLESRVPAGNETFTALISSAKKDEHHPRKVVVRAMIHRGGKVIATEGISKRTGHNAPNRKDWVVATPLEYPGEQEV